MSPLNVHMHTNNSFHHDINLIPKSLFFLPHLTSCLSYSSGNKIESKEQGLNIWLMTLCCHRCMTHFVCLPSILAASIPVPLFLSVCACFSLPCLFSYKHGHQVPVWRIKSNMNTVSREHRKAPNEPREAGSRKVTVLEKVMRRFNTLSVDKYC